MPSDEDIFARLKGQAEEHYSRIREAGGPLVYCMKYLEHITRLKGVLQEYAVISDHGTSYPRLAVQLAAAVAISSPREEYSDQAMRGKVDRLLRAAWIQAAGHYAGSPSTNAQEVIESQSSETMSMIRKGVEARKAQAADQWDQVAPDTAGLVTIAMYGREALRRPSWKDRWKGYAALLAIVAAVAAYGASNWYLSTKITAAYDTPEGLQQRREATDRVLAHDDVMSTKARKSGWFKLFLDWPMSPTDAEQSAFKEYVADIMFIHRGMVEAKLICGRLDMTDDQLIDLVDEINDALDVRAERIEELTAPQSAVVHAAAKLYPLPCEG
jgi:hypothetical protein